MKPIWISAIALLTFTSPLLAVTPAPIDPNARVAWSEVIEDPFDGLIVHDRNFNPSNGSAYVSTWSEDAIRLTYTWYEQRIIGYRTVWRERNVYVQGTSRRESYPEQEPIYERETHSRTPEKILFALNGEVYTYTGGPVSPELAAALIQVPLANTTIRLVWSDGRTDDLIIGRGTVRAWRRIYQFRAEEEPENS
ncbi:hypothetical protein K4A83_15750 [Spirulina subsalsa FACHB-351]|uniref:Uncharacterized protein n=1 Tax=Spirulina subsalsa FACHB-351 TaxID=234711 RepID=A0ABT3L8A3_9CYAN|nr:hypothetical protein [Spirulina subsalsa]MCW6037714.1 hypothetical protein [Spirulina subsalsa FACHB-351]